MAAFLKWFNGTPGAGEALRAALAHLWFVTIHSFDDGNGRIARAIADNTPQRYYSMSAQIHAERAQYYRMLEQTQRADTDITPCMSWFIGCLERALRRGLRRGRRPAKGTVP